MRETKRKWALHHVNYHDGWCSWHQFSFTARGFDKAVRKLARKLDRHPGVMLMIADRPEMFSLHVVED